MSWLSSSLRWVLRAEFPTLTGTIEKLRPLETHSLNCPSRSPSVTNVRAAVLYRSHFEPPSTGSAASFRAWSLFRRRLLPASLRGSPRSPKFLGEPRCEHALLFDPGPVTPNRFLCESLLPSTATDGVGFRATCRISGPNHTACSLAIYASPEVSPHPTQDSLPAGHHPMLDRIRTCRVLNERFPTLLYVIVIPLPEACLAHRLPSAAAGELVRRPSS
jgi:hypothetical protein